MEGCRGMIEGPKENCGRGTGYTISKKSESKRSKTTVSEAVG